MISRLLLLLCVGMCVQNTAYVWRLEENLADVVFSVCSGGPTRVIRLVSLDGKQFYPVNHLAGPPPCAFIIAPKSPSLSSHIHQLLELSI